MNIQNLFAERIGGKDFGINNEEYKFALIKKWKSEAQKSLPKELYQIDIGGGRA